jgi:branched-chain amino acid transport system substrate-binding protein
MRVRKDSTGLLAVFGAVVLGLSACSSGSSGGSGSTTSGGGDSSSTEIPIVSALELSGAYATGATPHDQMLQLGIDHVNDSGGVTVNGKKYTFKYVSVDSGSDVNNAAARWKEARSKGQFIFGPTTSPMVSPVIPFSGKDTNQITFAASVLTATQVKSGDSTNNLSELPTTDVIADCQAADVRRWYPQAKTWSLMLSSDATGQNYSKFYQPAIEGQKFQVLSTSYDPATTDFQPIVDKVLAGKPDIFGTSNSIGSVTSTVIKMLQQAGYTNPVSGGLGISKTQVEQAVGHPLEGFSFPLVGTDFTLSTSAAAEDVKSKLKSKFGVDVEKDPSIYFVAAITYDLVGMLAQAMTAAGTTTDVPKIMEQIKGHTFKGQLTTVGFDKDGNSLSPVGVQHVENGKYVSYDCDGKVTQN